jgi:hypothetical protein
MNPKIRISAAELFMLLADEFKRRQVLKCSACVFPFPYRVDRRDAEAPNWEVPVPVDCSNGCARVIDDMAFEFGELYELKPPEEGDH